MKKPTIKDRSGGLLIVSRESREQNIILTQRKLEYYYKKIVDMINGLDHKQESLRKLKNQIDQYTNQIKILDAYQEIIKTYLRKIAAINNGGNQKEVNNTTNNQREQSDETANYSQEILAQQSEFKDFLIQNANLTMQILIVEQEKILLQLDKQVAQLVRNRLQQSIKRQLQSIAAFILKLSDMDQQFYEGTPLIERQQLRKYTLKPSRSNKIEDQKLKSRNKQEKASPPQKDLKKVQINIDIMRSQLQENYLGQLQRSNLIRSMMMKGLPAETSAPLYYSGYNNDRKKSDIVEQRGQIPEREGEEEDMSTVNKSDIVESRGQIPEREGEEEDMSTVNKSDIVELRGQIPEREGEEEDMSTVNKSDIVESRGQIPEREGEEEDMSSVGIVQNSKEQLKVSYLSRKKTQERQTQSSFNSVMSELWSHKNALNQQVGLLICVWFGNGKKVSITSLASAFAISSRTIVTCAHAVVESKYLRPCDKAYFFPPNGKVYETECHDFLRYTPIESNTNYGIKPLIQDVAVMVLKDQLPEGPFLELSSQPLEKGDKIEVWGYPSEEYQLGSIKREMNSLVHKGEADIPEIKRKDVEGKYLDSVGFNGENYVLVHTAKTQKGHSGSPILQVGGSNSNIKVVGIHTHRGYGNTNEGLSMVSLHETIQKYRKELLESHNICERQQRVQLKYRKNQFKRMI